MKNLINEKQKHLLYKDEIGSTFLVLKYMEIYRKSNAILRCYCWKRKVFTQLQKTGLIFNELITDDKLYCFETKITNLTLLIATGSHIRRVHKKGAWLKDKEIRLGHRIYPFNPHIPENK